MTYAESTPLGHYNVRMYDAIADVDALLPELCPKDIRNRIINKVDKLVRRKYWGWVTLPVDAIPFATCMHVPWCAGWPNSYCRGKSCGINGTDRRGFVRRGFVRQGQWFCSDRCYEIVSYRRKVNELWLFKARETLTSLREVTAKSQ